MNTRQRKKRERQKAELAALLFTTPAQYKALTRSRLRTITALWREIIEEGRKHLKTVPIQ